MQSSSLIPGTALTLPQNPTVVGAALNPAGLPGQHGFYVDRPYVWDGSGWASDPRTRSILRVPENSAVRWFFLGDDIDGDGSYNANRTDMDTIPTWKNKGGSSTIQATQSANYAYPALVKWDCMGRGGVYFNGNFDSLTLAASASGALFEQCYTTGLFEIHFALRAGMVPGRGAAGGTNYAYLLYSSDGGTRGCTLLINFDSPNPHLQLLLTSGLGTIANATLSGVSFPFNQTCYGYARGDGSKVWLSLNGSAEASTNMTTGNFQAGVANSDLMIGAKPGGTSQFSGCLNALLLVDGALLASQRHNFQQELRRVLEL